MIVYVALLYIVFLLCLFASLSTIQYEYLVIK